MNEYKKPESIEEYREYGKILLMSSDYESRSDGIKYILRASHCQDPEAEYILAQLVKSKTVIPKKHDPDKYIVSLLYRSASNGYLEARNALNALCMERYSEAIDRTDKPEDGPLTDFDGKPIKIKKTGMLTPVDAVLEYSDGINVLNLSLNLCIMDLSGVPDLQRLTDSVISGIKLWEGDYIVFGNQPLKVKIDITTEERFFDNVYVITLNGKIAESAKRTINAIGTKDKKARLDDVFDHKRSFASSGIGKWSTKSRKTIFLQSKKDRFDDYDEIMHVSKHEFGHVLGLGDLYESSTDRLKGVDGGTYAELDGYYISDNVYNLVMCDHHGPISNNDIEMIVLAFSRDEAQLYQKRGIFDKISEALGQGN